MEGRHSWVCLQKQVLQKHFKALSNEWKALSLKLISCSTFIYMGAITIIISTIVSSNKFG